MAGPENAAPDDGEDIVVTDRELFDQAIAPQPPAPAEAKASEPTPQPAPQEATPSQRQRDEQGRFVPRPAQQPPQKPAPQQQPQRMPEDHRVPLRELLDERERRQRIEAEANQLRQAWAQVQQAQQAAAAQQAPQTIFDNPDDYLANRVMNPLRQEGYTLMTQVKDGLSREMANSQFGEQQVNAALADLTRVRYTPQGDFVFRQIMESGHPYGALVRWHNSVRAQQAIGPDPNAWLRKQQEQWLNDPKVHAEVLQRVRQQQQGRPPNVSLPPSLSSVPAASGRIEEQGDLSNESLYRYAIK